jgi:hypothetical protein
LNFHCCFDLRCFSIIILLKLFHDYSHSIKTIYFKYFNFKVTTFTQWWIVKGGTAFRFSVSNILVHPNCLAIPKTRILKSWPELRFYSVFLLSGFVSSCPKKILNKHAFMHLKLAKYALKSSKICIYMH